VWHRYLITGGAAFLGVNLIRFLLAEPDRLYREILREGIAD